MTTDITDFTQYIINFVGQEIDNTPCNLGPFTEKCYSYLFTSNVKIFRHSSLNNS